MSKSAHLGRRRGGGGGWDSMSKACHLDYHINSFVLEKARPLEFRRKNDPFCAEFYLERRAAPWGVPTVYRRAGWEGFRLPKKRATWGEIPRQKCAPIEKERGSVWKSPPSRLSSVSCLLLSTIVVYRFVRHYRYDDEHSCLLSPLSAALSCTNTRMTIASIQHHWAGSSPPPPVPLFCVGKIPGCDHKSTKQFHHTAQTIVCIALYYNVTTI